MLALALLACTSTSAPPTIQWDGVAVSVDDAPIGAWADVCPDGAMGCATVRDALRGSRRRGPDRHATIAIPGARPWKEAARLLVTASDAGHTEPELAIDGHPAVPTRVPDPKWLQPGTMITLAVVHDGTMRWMDAIATFQVGDGATCATVYAGEPDLEKICDDAAGTPAPANARLGGPTGCLVPAMPLSGDPYTWAGPLAEALAPFAGPPASSWVVAADDGDPTAAVGVITSAAAAAGLPPLIPAIATMDGSSGQPDCAKAVRDKRALDEAEARSIGAGTASVRMADGTVRDRAPQEIAACAGGPCTTSDGTTFEDARFVQIVDGPASKRWLIVAIDDGTLRGFACDATACEPHVAKDVQSHLRGVRVTVGHRRTPLPAGAPPASFVSDVVSSLRFDDAPPAEPPVPVPFGDHRDETAMVSLGAQGAPAAVLRTDGVTLDAAIDGLDRGFLCDDAAPCSAFSAGASVNIEWSWRLDGVGSDPPAPRAHITAITATDPH